MGNTCVLLLCRAGAGTGSPASGIGTGGGWHEYPLSGSNSPAASMCAVWIYARYASCVGNCCGADHLIAHVSGVNISAGAASHRCCQETHRRACRVADGVIKMLEKAARGNDRKWKISVLALLAG